MRRRCQVRARACTHTRTLQVPSCGRKGGIPLPLQPLPTHHLPHLGSLRRGRRHPHLLHHPHHSHHHHHHHLPRRPPLLNRLPCMAPPRRPQSRPLPPHSPPRGQPHRSAPSSYKPCTSTRRWGRRASTLCSAGRRRRASGIFPRDANARAHAGGAPSETTSHIRQCTQRTR